MPTVPRVEYEELPAELAGLLRAKVERLGYLGEFFQVAANLPDVLEPFVVFTERSKAHVPQPLVEVVALSVASVLDNAYERNQHERLCIDLGYGARWIRAVEACDPARIADPAEQATQQYVLAALRTAGARSAPGRFAALTDAVGHQAALGTAFMTARYVAHALLVDTFDLAPPVPPINPTPDAARS